MEKIKGQQLDFTPQNIFKLKQLVKGESFTEQPNLKECGLFEVLYLAVVDPALRAIGAIDKGEPYFVGQGLKYEAKILQEGIEGLGKTVEGGGMMKQ